MDQLTVESLFQLYWGSPLSRQQHALKAFHAALTGTDVEQPEPLLNLKQVAASAGYTSPTLWRLGIHAVDEGFGGRPRYRLSRVLEYLRSPECQKVLTCAACGYVYGEDEGKEDEGK